MMLNHPALGLHVARRIPSLGTFFNPLKMLRCRLSGLGWNSHLQGQRTVNHAEWEDTCEKREFIPNSRSERSEEGEFHWLERGKGGIRPASACRYISTMVSSRYVVMRSCSWKGLLSGLYRIGWPRRTVSEGGWTATG